MSTNTSGHGAFTLDLGRIYWIYALSFIAFTVLLAILEQVGLDDRVLGYLVVLFTLGAYATIGVLARTMQVAEFYVAGRRVPALYNGMAAAADWTSGTVFIGLAGSLFVLGHDGVAFVLGLAVGFILVGVLVAPYLRKFGAYTVPDFIATRFAGLPARLAAIAVLLVCSFALLAAQVHATGLIAARFLGLDIETGIFIAVAALLASGLLGGMRAVTWTQVAQYIVMIIAFMVPAIVLAASLYDLPVPQLGYGPALGDIAEREQQILQAGFADSDTFAAHLAPFASLGTANFVALVLTLALGAASFPHLLMHYSTTPSVRDARRSVAWTLLFVVLILVTAPAYAAFAKLAVYHTAIGANLAALPDWIVTQSSVGLIEIHGLSADVMVGHVAAVRDAIAVGAGDVGVVADKMSAESARAWAALDSSVQAAVFNAISEDPTIKPDEVWQRAIWAAAILDGNVDGLLHLDGFAIDPDAILFAAPEIAGLPAAIRGIVVAGALAATLSTAGGLLTTIANTLSHDAYYRTLNPLASTAQRLVIARMLMIAVAAAAGWLAINRIDDVLQVVGWSFSLAAAGNFPTLVLGIWWKRATAAGAVTGMVAGLAATAGYIGVSQLAPDFGVTMLGMSPVDPVVHKNLVTGLADAVAMPPVGWLGISNVAAGLFGVPIGFLTIVAVSLISRRPVADVETFVDDIRTPSGRSYMEKERAAERVREFGRGPDTSSL